MKTEEIILEVKKFYPDARAIEIHQDGKPCGLWFINLSEDDGVQTIRTHHTEHEAWLYTYERLHP